MDTLNKYTVTEVINAYEGYDTRPETDWINRDSCGIQIMITGETTYISNGRRVVADKKHAVLFPHYVRYKKLNTNPGSYYMLNFYCKDGLFIDEITSIELEDPRLYYDDCKRMKDIRWMNEYRAETFSLLYGIIAKLELENHKCDIIHSAVLYMKTNYSDASLDNKTLAKKVNVSESHFRNLFKAAYGITPHKYLMNIRIRHAKQALYNSDISIAQIAETCGFSSAFYFSKAFKAEVGMSPTAYRKAADYIFE